MSEKFDIPIPPPREQLKLEVLALLGLDDKKGSDLIQVNELLSHILIPSNRLFTAENRLKILDKNSFVLNTIWEIYFDLREEILQEDKLKKEENE